MERQETYVGIDVAKAGLDISVCPSDESWTVSNDEQRIRQLVSCLPLHVQDTSWSSDAAAKVDRDI